MNKVAKTTIMLMVVTMITKILGFLREIVLTSTYGTSNVSDAYITAISIPGVIFVAIGTAIATTFIPLFIEVENKEGNERAIQFADSVFNIVIIISILIATLGFIFAKPLVKVFAMNFKGETLIIASEFTKIMMIGIVFIGMSDIIKAWLQINGNFKIPGMISLPYNILIIISIIISAKTNILILPIGVLMAMMSQFLFQLPHAYKLGYRYRLKINFKDEYVKKMLILIIPVFLGIAVNQVNTIVDRSLASTLGEGIITSLNSANKLNGFVIAMFISTLAAVIYPKLSQLSNSNDNTLFIDTICKSINSVIILIIPISIGAIVLSTPIVKIVFERGAFTSNSTIITSTALALYSIGMVGTGLMDILGKVFYSLKDTKTPMKNGALSMGINIVLNIILIQFLGYAGLPLATSIASIISVVLMFISLKNKIGYFGQDKIIKTMTKVFISSGIMAILTKISYTYLSLMIEQNSIGEIITLIGSVIVGIISYFTMISLLKVEEMNILLESIKNKILKQKRVE